MVTLSEKEIKDLVIPLKGYNHETTEAIFEMLAPIYCAGSSGVFKESKYKILERVTGKEISLRPISQILELQ